MEYFEWYGIEPALEIDEKTLQQAYYKKSKEFHPDFHIDGTEEEQTRIMQLSVLNTKAYNTLKQFESRLKYILEQKSLITEGDKYTLPPDFLMEMMEINERISEALLPENAALINKCTFFIQNLESDLKQAIAPLCAKNLVSTLSEKDLHILLDYHYKQRYVWRLYSQLRNEKNI